MKNGFIRNAILFFILLNCSCSNEIQTEAAALFNSWEVVEYKAGNNSQIESGVFKPLMEFRKDGTYTLKLNVNNCMGNYTNDGAGSIEISAPGCTKICCDNEHSLELMQLLSLASNYSIRDDKLHLELSGGGWIVLNKIKLQSNE